VVDIRASAHWLEEVTLALRWGHPFDGVDFLDGSGLCYAEDRCVEVVDYRGPLAGSKILDEEPIMGEDRLGLAGLVGPPACAVAPLEGGVPGVSHSGDMVDINEGRHTLRVDLPRLPGCITDIFFTLSAYNCEDLTLFQKPTIEVLDSKSNRVLCTYTLGPYAGNRACVLASLHRGAKGWEVVAHGRSSGGTVRDYSELQSTIASLQARYAHRRRRMPLLLLHALERESRARPAPATLAARICDLPDALVHTIMRYV